MSVVLFLTFGALISDKIGADLVMILALTLCLVSGVISMEEGMAGFSNEGLLTVLAIVVVTAGINHTGVLDWYMRKMHGRPKSMAIAQLRPMTPIAIVSDFLNNTHVVVVMITIVQRCGEPWV
jgi:Na+/H+ antiporter NhaD/arsenite permease-like protein